MNENGKEPTQYVVLRETNREGESDWQNLGSFDGGNAATAIRAAAGGNGPGTYVAVPARSFKPVPVKVETQTAVKLG